ncbi:MAG: hypothetical protein HY894_10125 [Deltaproteobacteria bacterium]|nr:hypothetical protein [Deltaproteobacteria bacterium]
MSLITSGADAAPLASTRAKEAYPMFSRQTIAADLLSGVAWGWLSLVTNSVTGAFVFEGGFIHDLAAFTVAGGVNGFVAGGLLSLAGARLPFKSNALKAALTSTALWLVLRAGAMMLSNIDPERYHAVNGQSIQGFFLAILLGLVIAAVRKATDAKDGLPDAAR